MNRNIPSVHTERDAWGRLRVGQIFEAHGERFIKFSYSWAGPNSRNLEDAGLDDDRRIVSFNHDEEVTVEYACWPDDED